MQQLHNWKLLKGLLFHNKTKRPPPVYFKLSLLSLIFFFVIHVPSCWLLGRGWGEVGGVGSHKWVFSLGLVVGGGVRLSLGWDVAEGHGDGLRGYWFKGLSKGVRGDAIFP